MKTQRRVINMIKFHNRYDEYAYRVSTRDHDPSVTELIEGTWVTLNEQGKIIVSDGTKKSFISIASTRTGRDTITPSGKGGYLMGHAELSTNVFDPTGTYGAMTPLKVENGVLTPWEAEDGSHRIEAYSIGAPVDGFLRIATNI